MNRLKAVMRDLIAGDAPLGPERRDHLLRRGIANHRKCHIGVDFLLMFRVEGGLSPSGSIIFVRAGTHAVLFG